MAESPSVIQIEFNELSPTLMQQFITAGKLPNFQRLYEESQVFTTDAEDKPPALEPWVQWVTVHVGMPYSEHRVFRLGDGHKLAHECVWDVVSKAGKRVWVCGSMNLRYSTPMNGWVLPDPWANAVPYPNDLDVYHKFVRTSVMERTRDKVPLSKGDYLKFLTFMASHGLSATTIKMIINQLRAERGGTSKWKRAVILDRLQFDLFRATYQRLRPDFATFFSNSTAHFQHNYWRNMQPELFTKKPTATEQEEFDQAILFGYQRMDDLIGEFLKLAGPNTTLVFCSALGQQPCLNFEEQGGKTFYRPNDFEAFLAFAGVKGPHRISPVMSEQFHVYFDSEAEAAVAAKQLEALRLGGQEVMHVRLHGNEVFAGCKTYHQVKKEETVRSEMTGQSKGFFELFYQVEGLKSGMHQADGILWIRYPNRKHVVHREPVSLTSIAPTVLRVLSVPAPAHMRGASLNGV
jgi:hypothetical protein